MAFRSIASGAFDATLRQLVFGFRQPNAERGNPSLGIKSIRLNETSTKQSFSFHRDQRLVHVLRFCRRASHTRTKVLLGFALQRSLFLAVAPSKNPRPSPAPPPLYPFDIDQCRFNRSIIHVKWINKETRLGGVVFVNKSCQSDETVQSFPPISIAASRNARSGLFAPRNYSEAEIYRRRLNIPR